MTSILGTAIRSFALAVMMLEVLWGVLLAAICFWVASDGSIVRGVIAASTAMVVVTVCALVLATYFACQAVVSQAVANAGLGRVIFDALFERAIGITGDDPGQQQASARVRTHMSREDVEQTLNDAARSLLSVELPTTEWATPFYWLARMVQRVSVWATVKVIVNSCSHDGTSVNMFELRDRLASTIDSGVVSYVRQYLTRLTLAVISAASTLAVLLSLGISHLPF